MAQQQQANVLEAFVSREGRTGRFVENVRGRLQTLPSDAELQQMNDWTVHLRRLCRWRERTKLLIEEKEEGLRANAQKLFNLKTRHSLPSRALKTSYEFRKDSIIAANSRLQAARIELYQCLSEIDTRFRGLLFMAISVLPQFEVRSSDDMPLLLELYNFHFPGRFLFPRGLDRALAEDILEWAHLNGIPTTQFSCDFGAIAGTTIIDYPQDLFAADSSSSSGGGSVKST